MGTSVGTPWGHGDTHGDINRDTMGTRGRHGDIPGMRWGWGGPWGPTAVTVPRYGFLLDKALIICKRRGDAYEAKDVVDLQSHQLRDSGLGPRDGKKVPGLKGGPECPSLVAPLESSGPKGQSLVAINVRVWWPH